MATKYTVRVQRKFLPPGNYRGRVRSEYGGFNKDMEIPEEVRFKTGGEAVTYFEIEVEGEKVVFLNRVPTPDSEWKEVT